LSDRTGSHLTAPARAASRGRGRRRGRAPTRSQTIAVPTSEHHLKAHHAAPEHRAGWYRAARRILDRFADDVALHLDPPVHVPIHAERGREISVAKDDV